MSYGDFEVIRVGQHGPGKGGAKAFAGYAEDTHVRFYNSLSNPRFYFSPFASQVFDFKKGNVLVLLFNPNTKTVGFKLAKDALEVDIGAVVMQQKGKKGESRPTFVCVPQSLMKKLIAAGVKEQSVDEHESKVFVARYVPNSEIFTIDLNKPLTPYAQEQAA